MPLETNSLDASQETTVFYYLAGITVGIIAFPLAKDWALSVVEALDEPSIEIIEAATASNRENVMEALAAASVGADQQAAGRWLLADLEALLVAGDVTPMQAVRFAKLVVQATSLPQNLWIDLDVLDDALDLAVHGIFGSVDDYGDDVLQTLRTSWDASNSCNPMASTPLD